MKRTFFLLLAMLLTAAAVVVILPPVVKQARAWLWAPTKKIIDAPTPAVTVRVLDVGQGDATYIYSGGSRAIIDGGPDPVRFGKLLDSLGIRDTMIDVVILSHAHYDHYNGLRALFESKRRIKIRYFFENKDLSTAISLAKLRDSIQSRMRRDGMVYRDTDDPCGDERAVCTITMRGGTKLHVLKPMQDKRSANNRSAVVKLVGADSASFSMWMAGDAEFGALKYFEKAQFQKNPGMAVDVMKAGHHGSCNAVTARYLKLLQPKWAIVSLAAKNDYGHMHDQAKAAYTKAGVPWYRTDQNGTITIQSMGTPGSGVTVTPSRGVANMKGPSDRRMRGAGCGG